MFAYIVRRLLLVIPTVFFALSFLFLLFFALPGDPATLLAGGADRNPDPGVVERARERYGLDDPIPQQFVDYWQRTVQWDLGESFKSGRSVNDLLGEKAVNSLRLAIWAIIIEIIIGISVGVLSAIRRYSLADIFTTIGTAAA
ncbi:MAG: ABC transporter permease, partial [Acidimicrobiales bacterium]|nr:ABC transporter permease [Acidimicrobiales bacterium]